MYAKLLNNISQPTQMKKSLLTASFISIFTLFALVLSTTQFQAAAAECPEDAEDCFMCGDTPCTTDCEGALDEESGERLSCDCPQGEECVCYCPYTAESNSESDSEDGTETQEQVEVEDEDEGRLSYGVIDVVGKPVIYKHSSGFEQNLKTTSTIDPGDKIIIGSGEMATITMNDLGATAVFGPSNAYLFPTDDGIVVEGTADIWMVTKLIGRVAEGFEFDDSNQPDGDGVNIYTNCSLGQDIILNQFMQNYSEQCASQYEIKSEILLEINKTKSSLKVIEGEVSVKNAKGETDVVTGKSLEVRASTDLESVEVENYELSEVDDWWVESFNELECPESCDENQTQTSAPGCSCIDLEDQEEEPLGGLWNPLYTLGILLVCGVVIGGGVILAIFLVGKKKKTDSAQDDTSQH